MGKTWYFRFSLLLAGVLWAVAYLMPTAAPAKVPGFLKSHLEKKIQLGLDLQGGSHLVYEVMIDKAVSDKADRLEADITDKLKTELKVAAVKTERPNRDDIVFKFANAADAAKLDAGFLRGYRSNLDEVERDARSGTVTLRMDANYVHEVEEYAVRQAVETLRNRVDEFGVKEPEIRRRGNDISVDLPGVESASVERLKTRIAQTAQLEFKIADDASDYMKKIAPKVPKDSGIKADVEDYDGLQNGNVQVYYLRAKERETLDKFFDSLSEEDKPPRDHQVLYEEVQARDDKGNPLPDKEWRTYYLNRRADLTGEYVADAQQDWDQQTGRPEVNLTYDRNGAAIFEKVSGENVGRRMPIILDGVVKSAPVLQSRIGGGRARITLGGYRDPVQMQQEAGDLAAVLRAGALPAPLKKVFEVQVGPSLGKDSIRQGAQAFGVAALIITLFMAWYYRVMGVLADVAMILNVLFVLAIMAGFEASLTLPGIAGLVLGLGMAVDGNVIINERIREELKAGKSPRSAVDMGYKRAFVTVFDSHVTTAIAGIVLLQFGSGPLRGFATTLLIGIVCSLLTSVWVTRVLVDFLVDRVRVQRLSI